MDDILKLADSIADLCIGAQLQPGIKPKVLQAFTNIARLSFLIKEAKESEAKRFTPEMAFANMLRLWKSEDIKAFYDMLSRRPEVWPDGIDPTFDATITKAYFKAVLELMPEEKDIGLSVLGVLRTQDPKLSIGVCGMLGIEPILPFSHSSPAPKP